MIKKPAIASLDSANGPSVTGFLPVTILPSFERGCPPLNLPWLFSCSNQAVNRARFFCISSGERPLCQRAPRKRNRYSDVAVVEVIFVSDPSRSRLFEIRRMKPKKEDVSGIFYCVSRAKSEDGDIALRSVSWKAAPKFLSA